ncbi:MAG: FG-GAP-like repeat-containing protein, partial [Myxococcaceae bacterium]
MLTLPVWMACGAPPPSEDVQTEETVQLASGLKRPPPEEEPEAADCKGASGSIYLTKTAIALGEGITVSWSVTTSSACTGEILLSSIAVAAKGSMTLKPMSTRPFRLTVGSQEVAVVWLTVALPGTVHIKGNTSDWRNLMLQALWEGGKRVVLAHDVDMDMTGFEAIHVGANTTLTSEAPPLQGNTTFNALAFAYPGDVVAVGPPARSARSLGPRLFTRGRPKPLFDIKCNGKDIFGENVKMNGFRLQGPHWDTAEGQDNLERGIMINSCQGVEISNLEISGWSGQAIYVADDFNLLSEPEQVTIQGNFIHHNQHAGGNGYGVDVSEGAYATIERNVFDFNRHAIAASGKEGTGYRARENLVLKGGGLHDKWYNTYTHQFDVHGDENWGPDVWPNEHTWNGGNAGDRFWITDNAFQYRNDRAIKIRGEPRKFVQIARNFFAHGSVDDAVETKGGPRAQILTNTASADGFGQYGVCDFDGDGKDDLFLPTGATWWYSSGGKMHWSFLNAQPDRLHQLGLGDFNGDGRCDVFALRGNTWAISYSGTAPFTSLPGSYPLNMAELRFADFNNDKVTDIFHRSSDGQWSVVSPGIHGWRDLQSSSFPLTDLRFGDFNGDGAADVLSRSGGRWAVSWSGLSGWQNLNPTLSDNVESLHIANVDGLPGDDILRYVATSD